MTAKDAHSKGASDAATAKALKRALAQLSCIRNAVPNYAATHAHVLAAIRGLTPEEDDLSIAGSDILSDLESPVLREGAELGTSEPSLPDENVATPSQPGFGTNVEEKYYKEESEEQVALVAVAPVSAFLSVIGGFSLAHFDTGKKVWRRRKVKREAMPLTPEQEQKMAKVESAASAVLKEVHEKLWSRWGEPTAGQREFLGKQIRRGLRHLPQPTTAHKKLVAYLCKLGNDWDSMVEASRLNRSNIHEWSDQDWLTHASPKQEDHVEANDMADSGTDSGESVWEEVVEGAYLFQAFEIFLCLFLLLCSCFNYHTVVLFPPCDAFGLLARPNNAPPGCKPGTRSIPKKDLAPDFLTNPSNRSRRWNQMAVSGVDL
jgi:hypothetical protein